MITSYKNIRPIIKSGDLVAWSSGQGFQINLIRIFTRSEYTHVGITWVVGGRVLLIEATPSKGVCINTLSDHTPFYHLHHPDRIWTPEMEQFALSKVGERYSRWEAIMGFFNKTTDNGIWECAELVQQIYAVTDKCISEVPATPSSIVKYCMKTYQSVAVYVEV